MTYHSDDSYGVITDLHTVALVGKNSSIDWICFPRFASLTVFATLLDKRQDGRFITAPESRRVGGHVQHLHVLAGGGTHAGRV